MGAGESVKRPHEAEEQTKEQGSSKKYRQDLVSLPTRQYLDQTVVPILLQVTTHHVTLGPNLIKVILAKHGRCGTPCPLYQVIIPALVVCLFLEHNKVVIDYTRKAVPSKLVDFVALADNEEMLFKI